MLKTLKIILNNDLIIEKMMCVLMDLQTEQSD